jgi:hypothetical protein
MSTKATSISKDMDVAKHLSKLHNRYVIVPAYNAPNNIVFVCKKHYIDCLIKVLDVNNSLIKSMLKLWTKISGNI